MNDLDAQLAENRARFLALEAVAGQFACPVCAAQPEADCISSVILRATGERSKIGFHFDRVMLGKTQ